MNGRFISGLSPMPIGAISQLSGRDVGGLARMEGADVEPADDVMANCGWIVYLCTRQMLSVNDNVSE